jgi:hypothetical protein
MFQTIPYPPVPADTARAARSLYGRGNVYLRLGDALSNLICDLVPAETKKSTSDIQTGQAKIQLALLTIFQFAEELTNQQIVVALRNRVELKYALHLPMNYPNIDPISLCEFRRQLFANPEYQQIFQTLLDRTGEFGLFKKIHDQPVLVEPALLAVCTATRFEEVEEAMHQALEILAVSNPEWLRQVTLPFWYDRYSRQNQNPSYRSSEGRWNIKVLEIAADIQYLLDQIEQAHSPALASLPEVKELRRVWGEQFVSRTNVTAHTQDVQWRFTQCASCIKEINQMRRCDDQAIFHNNY